MFANREWLHWRAGRQHTGYDKMLVFRHKRCDIYFLRYPQGVGIPLHRDAVDGFRHYRFNFVLRQPQVGGLFNCEYPIWITDRIKFFRSDFQHTVSPVVEGQRVLLSVGFLKKA